MEKAEKWLNKDNKSEPQRDTISLKVEHKNVVVTLDSISYIEAMDNYVKIYRKNDPMVVSQITMKELESKLPGDKFIRIHRSFIVPLEEIEIFSNRKISIRNVSKTIPVGRTYNEIFQNLYSIFKSKKR